jgi:hypothetical protein
MQAIAASAKSDLLSQLSKLDIRVPLRTEGRKSEHSERWSACRLLATLAEAGDLKYPLRLEHRDRPDFLLSVSDRSIGIECTEAVPANWAWANARNEEKQYDSIMPLQQFAPGEPLMTPGEIDEIARGVSCGDGWAGRAPERQWADAMFHFADAKARKIAAPDFTRYEQNWVLIYDNWPLPNVDENIGAGYLQATLNGSPLPFDRIIVECTRTFVVFARSAFSIFPLNDLWRDR